MTYMIMSESISNVQKYNTLKSPRAHLCVCSPLVALTCAKPVGTGASLVKVGSPGEGFPVTAGPLFLACIMKLQHKTNPSPLELFLSGVSVAVQKQLIEESANRRVRPQRAHGPSLQTFTDATLCFCLPRRRNFSSTKNRVFCFFHILS